MSNCFGVYIFCLMTANLAPFSCWPCGQTGSLVFQSLCSYKYASVTSGDVYLPVQPIVGNCLLLSMCVSDHLGMSYARSLLTFLVYSCKTVVPSSWSMLADPFSSKRSTCLLSNQFQSPGSNCLTIPHCIMRKY